MKILLPLDSSKYADANVAYIKDIAKKTNAELLLLHIVALPTSAKGVMDFSSLEAKGKEFLDGHKKRLEADGVNISAKVVVGFGSPGAIINEEAKASKADLVALGAKGKSLTRNLLMGSVADDVSRNAPCSVLIIR